MLTNSLEAAVAERAAAADTAGAGGPDLAPPVIAVRGLRKAYGDREAVRGVDLTIRRGEIFAFLGPNGAGKTTTVEVLEGFLRADGGSVDVLGEDPASAPLRWRERVGIVQQESVTEPELTVRECLELYAGFYRAPRDVDATLALCGLADRADRRSGMLSGGEKRRLDVALALIGDPDLVFLDEPTTGFDPAARREAWAVVDGLRALGKTIFLTTHYLEEAERLADRIAVIVGGRIVAEGTPATLGARDRAAGVIGFTLPPGAALPPALAERAEAEAAAAGVGAGRVSLRSDRPMEDLHALSGWALDHGLELHDIEVRRPTLEDVYLELVSTHTDDRS